MPRHERSIMGGLKGGVTPEQLEMARACAKARTEYLESIVNLIKTGASIRGGNFMVLKVDIEREAKLHGINSVGL